ncbi:A-kinase anchor protein 13-like isoform X2 [Littorina saxatilis]
MAFNPVEAPVYGGELFVINLGHPQTPGTPEEEEEEEEEENSGIASVSEEDELYLVLEGRMQTHVVTMKHTQNLVWQAPIPGHDCAERVYLSVIRRSTAEHFDCVAVGDFEYTCDSAYSLAQFLLNSVNDPNSLEDVELIRSDEFDLANEIFSTLDQRLCAAFRHIQFPEGWHHLGLDMEQDDSEPDCRETLLHLAGRLGLHDTALYLLGKPGSEDALGLINHEGRLPCAVAADNRFDDIAELFSG